MKIIAQQFLGGLSPLLPANRGAAAPRAPLLPTAMNLSMQKCRGQYYDGCSTVAGSKGGVAAMIKKIEPRALYTHCYEHALNLACADTIKQCRIVKNGLETTHEITKLVKCSPKRDSRLETIRKNTSDEAFSYIQRLCPTRWTVCADSMQSITKGTHSVRVSAPWANH